MTFTLRICTTETEFSRKNSVYLRVLSRLLRGTKNEHTRQ